MLGRTELATLGGGRLGLTEPDTLGGSPMSKAAPSRSMIEGAGEPAPALGAGGVCDTCPLSKAAPSLSMTEGAGEPARLGRTEPATLGAVGSPSKASASRPTIDGGAGPLPAFDPAAQTAGDAQESNARAGTNKKTCIPGPMQPSSRNMYRLLTAALSGVYQLSISSASQSESSANG